MKKILSVLINYVPAAMTNLKNKPNILFVLQILVDILENATDLQEFQNTMDELDCTRMLLSVLSDFNKCPYDDELFTHFLQLFIKLLQDGNVKVQKRIYFFLITFKHSETIFSKFHKCF